MNRDELARAYAIEVSEMRVLGGIERDIAVCALNLMGNQAKTEEIFLKLNPANYVTKYSLYPFLGIPSLDTLFNEINKRQLKVNITALKQIDEINALWRVEIDRENGVNITGTGYLAEVLAKAILHHVRDTKTRINK